MNPLQKMLLTKIKTELPTFEQERYRFYERSSDLIKVVEIQFLNTGSDRKSFTMNYGVSIPMVDEILWGQSKSRLIEASTCLFTCNVNDILSKFTGKPKVKYWDLVNLESLFKEIVEMVRVDVYPFSKMMNSMQGVNTFINKTNFPAKYIALYPLSNLTLKYVLNEIEEARILEDELRKKDFNYYESHILDVRNRLIQKGYYV